MASKARGPTVAESSGPRKRRAGKAVAVDEVSSSESLATLKPRRTFPTIEYASRVSHFDPRSDYRDFHGFFTLFWIGLAIMAITSILRNIKDAGVPLRVQIWGLFPKKVAHLALADFLMVASTAIVVPLQKRARRGGPLKWRSWGMPLQVVYQALWLGLWIALPFVQNWVWTAQVFLLLHTMVMLMKMHSYAFYNGYLSETEDKLHKMPPSDSVKRSLLITELTSPLGAVKYPSNLTWKNWADYTLVPTLCYELQYPRVETRSLRRLFSHVAATFGCIFLLTVTSEEFILPVLSDARTRLDQTLVHTERMLIMAETISWLLFPFTLIFLLVFLVIFEYVLGFFAEITYFADRHFYSDWWNSTDWMEFSREWNVPVYSFLRRHVYSASRPLTGRSGAVVLTFLISAVGHEVIMACITKKLRGYGFVAQMLQLPFYAIQQTRFVKGRETVNNAMFWCSMIIGLSTICSMYVLF